jgi:hypothetical protein
MVPFFRPNRRISGGGDVMEAVTLPKPPIPSAPLSREPAAPSRDAFMAEYASLAQSVGVPVPDSAIGALKDFIIAQDWGLFSLADVIAYMDKKAHEESRDKSGWEWRPLREKDHMEGVSFGTPPRRWHASLGVTESSPASDYYVGPRKMSPSEANDLRARSALGLPSDYVSLGNGGVSQAFTVPSPVKVYDKTIPLHALRKVAAIERGFKKAPVSFFVCDYAPAPAIEYPDPFLMVCINNPSLAKGNGRFIVDFWDEPGFGLDKMLGAS